MKENFLRAKVTWDLEKENWQRNFSKWIFPALTLNFDAEVISAED